MPICPRCTKDVLDVHSCTPAPLTEEELRATFGEGHSQLFDRVRATALQALADRDRLIQTSQELTDAVVSDTTYGISARVLKAIKHSALAIKSAKGCK